MIRVNLYFDSGSLQSSHDCDNVQDAFNSCLRSGMLATARPVNTTSGCYIWNPGKTHTLEGFAAKLAMCCNDPRQYTENLLRAGITSQMRS